MIVCRSGCWLRLNFNRTRCSSSGATERANQAARPCELALYGVFHSACVLLLRARSICASLLVYQTAMELPQARVHR